MRTAHGNEIHMMIEQVYETKVTGVRSGLLQEQHGWVHIFVVS